MSAANRFLFETRFDAGAGPAPAPAPRKSFTAVELEAAKSAAHQAGLAAGRAAAQKEIALRLAAAVEALSAALARTMEDISARLDAHGRERVSAAAEMVRRLFPALAARHEFGEIEALLSECLARVADEPRIVLRLADPLVADFKPHLDELLARSSYAGKVILLGDPGLREGQARIEWADGGVERDAGAVWRDIDETLQRYFAGIDGPGTPGT